MCAPALRRAQLPSVSISGCRLCALSALALVCDCGSHRRPSPRPISGPQAAYPPVITPPPARSFASVCVSVCLSVSLPGLGSVLRVSLAVSLSPPGAAGSAPLTAGPPVSARLAGSVRGLISPRIARAYAGVSAGSAPVAGRRQRSG